MVIGEGRTEVAVEGEMLDADDQVSCSVMLTSPVLVIAASAMKGD